MKIMNVSSPWAESQSGKNILPVEWEVSPPLDVEIHKKHPLPPAPRRRGSGMARRSKPAYRNQRMALKCAKIGARRVMPECCLENRN